ncbi:MAG: SAM-dependent methyltransferase, partial [Desulfamplus sp.]|nr:SAM-dependent methyltransferase [Desulfamplus sp.]
MEPTALHPGKLLSISGFYWQTCTLHASVKLDIFTIIGKNSLTSEEVAAKMLAPVRSVAMLLDALCAMELLKKDGIRYSNTQISSKFLSKESPEYIGFMIMHHHHLVESWSKLDESVMSGKPIRSRVAS